MNIIGMYMLNGAQYEQEKIYQALNILYTYRENQFQEISQAVLSEKALKDMPRWERILINGLK